MNDSSGGSNNGLNKSSYSPPEAGGSAPENPKSHNTLNGSGNDLDRSEFSNATIRKTPPFVPIAFSSSSREAYEVMFQSDQEPWSEPSFSEAHESTVDMYSPGIAISQPTLRKRFTEDSEEDDKVKTKGRFAGFLRLICAALLCAIVSATATYVIIEYRIARGDFETDVMLPVEFITIEGNGQTRDEYLESLSNHFMGATVQTVTSNQAEYFGLVTGCRVSAILPDSVAEKAGVSVGDIIIKLGDSKIDSRDTLHTALRKYRSGDTDLVTVWRSGAEIALSITFDEDIYEVQPQRSLGITN